MQFQWQPLLRKIISHCSESHTLMMFLCKAMSNGQESPKLGIKLNTEQESPLKFLPRDGIILFGFRNCWYLCYISGLIRLFRCSGTALSSTLTRILLLKKNGSCIWAIKIIGGKMKNYPWQHSFEFSCDFSSLITKKLCKALLVYTAVWSGFL